MKQGILSIQKGFHEVQTKKVNKIGSEKSQNFSIPILCINYSNTNEIILVA